MPTSSLYRSGLLVLILVLFGTHAEPTPQAKAKTHGQGKGTSEEMRSNLLTPQQPQQATIPGMDKAIILNFNVTIQSVFGGLGTLLSDETHYYFLNATAISKQLESLSSNVPDTIWLALTQQDHEEIYLTMYMSKNGFPTSRKYDWKTDTQVKSRVEVKLPGIKRGIDWFIAVKPSKSPGVLSKFHYTLLLFEKRADESQGYNYWIVGGVTLAVIAASMYWFIARPLTRKNQKGPELSSPGTVKWLVAENELIPFTELDKRKSEIKQLNATMTTPKEKEKEKETKSSSAADPPPSGALNDSPPSKSASSENASNTTETSKACFRRSNSAAKPPQSPSMPAEAAKPQVVAPSKPATSSSSSTNQSSTTNQQQLQQSPRKMGSVGERAAMWEKLLSGNK